jgi:peptide/nickel transport system ATP-binding protein
MHIADRRASLAVRLVPVFHHNLGMSYLFVSHDLNVVRLLCERVIVMRAGEIVEQGFCDDVLGAPKTDYVHKLLAAVPHPPV